MEDVNSYVDALKEAGKITEEQSIRLREAMTDLSNLMIKAAQDPTDKVILTEIEFCKITIESLATVSFNQVRDKARDIATDLFIKGLNTALLAL